jgi:hypothetical protein
VAGKEIYDLALLLHDICPHAADPERTFSTMGWFQPPLRNSLDIHTVNMMTAIKQHLQAEQSVPKNRPAKAARQSPVGDVFMVTPHDALLAAQAATEAAEAEMAASQNGQVGAEVPDDLDILTATPEELQQVLEQMHREAQQEVGESSMTFTELLQSALEGFDIHDQAFDPQHIPGPPVYQPIGNLAEDTDADFDADALVASLLGE